MRSGEHAGQSTSREPERQGSRGDPGRTAGAPASARSEPVPAAQHMTIPSPALVLLVGAAGAGKTTFARRHFPPDAVLSSDDFRLVIAGDASDQSRNGAVFRALHRAAATRLDRGELVVVDATNVDHHARRPLLALARRAGVPAIAIILDLPLTTVLARNAARPGRTVDPAIVRRQHGRLRRGLSDGRPSDEGFAQVIRLTSAAAIEAIEVAEGG